MVQSMRNTDNRSVFQATIVFHIKLRGENPNRIIASFLKLSHEQLVSE